MEEEECPSIRRCDSRLPEECDHQAINAEGKASSSDEDPAALELLANYRKKGILLKKGMGRFYKPWHLRTIFLDLNQTLSYFDGNVLKGEVHLDGASVRFLSPAEAGGYANAFEIYNLRGVKRTKENSLILACGSPAEAKEWVHCLRSAAQSTVRERAANGPVYTSLLEGTSNGGAAAESDLDFVRKIREVRAKEAANRLQQENDNSSDCDS